MSYSLVCESLEPRMRRVSTSPLLQRPRRWNLGEGLGEGLGKEMKRGLGGGGGEGLGGG